MRTLKNFWQLLIALSCGMGSGLAPVKYNINRAELHTESRNNLEWKHKRHVAACGNELKLVRTTCRF